MYWGLGGYTLNLTKILVPNFTDFEYLKWKMNFISFDGLGDCYLEFWLQLVVDYFFICGMGTLRLGGWHVITYSQLKDGENCT